MSYTAILRARSREHICSFKRPYVILNEMKVFLLSILVGITSHASPQPSGFPNRGALTDARNIYKFIKTRRDILKSVSPEAHQFGTDELASALEKMGMWAKEMGMAPMWIGDISFKTGGKLAQHMTHQRGLDVDIAYIVPKHKTFGHRSIRFHNRFTQKWQTMKDVEKDFPLKENYALLKQVVRNLDVGAVYVGCSIYDALEKFDRTQSDSILKRIYAQKGHEDHFHLRMRCPANAKDCDNHWWVDPNKPEKKDKVDANGKYREC